MTSTLAEETFRSSTASPPIQVANRLGYVLRTLGIGASLAKPSLAKSARRKTGLSDFGDESFQEPLLILLNTVNAAADLSFVGRFFFRQMVQSALINRLQIQELLKSNTGIRNVAVKKPLFIVGYPRTGTTLLHNLLSLDPKNRTVKMYEALEPALKKGTADSRLEKAKRFTKGLKRLSPSLSRIHSLEAEGPDECLKLIENTFTSPHFLLYAHAPNYWRWLKEHHTDFRSVYEYHKLQLQILNHIEPSQRWVLKAPIHLFFLSSLIDVYPDARIIHLHRDPAAAIPSFCSLTAVSRALTGTKIDPVAIGEFAVELYEESFTRGMRARDQISPDNIVDISYDNLIKAPTETVYKIYRHFHYEIPSTMGAGISQWIEVNPQDKHGTHRYSPASFGLTQSRLEKLPYLSDVELS